MISEGARGLCDVTWSSTDPGDRGGLEEVGRHKKTRRHRYVYTLEDKKVKVKWGSMFNMPEDEWNDLKMNSDRWISKWIRLFVFNFCSSNLGGIHLNLEASCWAWVREPGAALLYPRLQTERESGGTYILPLVNQPEPVQYPTSTNRGNCYNCYLGLLRFCTTTYLGAGGSTGKETFAMVASVICNLQLI